FAACTLAVGVAGALPQLAQDPALLFPRIVAYPGASGVTPRGVAVWGIWYALGIARSPPAQAARPYNTPPSIAPLALLPRLRRGRSSPRELGTTLAASFALLYGTTSFWAFQYLAWSLPFWLFVDPRVAAPLSALLAAYVWGVYALYTGSPWLLGRWDFVNHA